MVFGSVRWKRAGLEFTASSDQVQVQLTWIKAKEPDTTSRQPELDLKSKNKPPTTSRRTVNVTPSGCPQENGCCTAAEQHQTIEACVDHNTKTEVRDTIVSQLLAPTKYRGEPVEVVINRDIVNSLYNHNKACHRLIYYTTTTDRGKRSRIDFDEGFDINDPGLLTSPPHTSPFNIESKEAMEAAILAERPNTPYQPQHRSRSKMKAKRQTDPNLLLCTLVRNIQTG
ncbi:unnamed protein product [Mytilus edulis]|uniref:Uncharacterized protein n=1 Tax=Mytilus edulis TaxID=6550 RepID=A0A8S3R2Z7_MYTED|nr:unnamed protein product [Mytilus edulis]